MRWSMPGVALLAAALSVPAAMSSPLSEPVTPAELERAVQSLHSELRRHRSARRYVEGRAALDRAAPAVLGLCRSCAVEGVKVGFGLADYPYAHLWAERVLAMSQTGAELIEAVTLVERTARYFDAPPLAPELVERIANLTIERRDPEDLLALEHLLFRHLRRSMTPGELGELVGERLGAADAAARAIVCRATEGPAESQAELNRTLLELDWPGPYLPAGDVSAAEIVYRGSLALPQAGDDSGVRLLLPKVLNAVVVVGSRGGVSAVLEPRATGVLPVEDVVAHVRGWLFEPGRIDSAPVPVCYRERLVLRPDSVRPIYSTKYTDALVGLGRVVELSADPTTLDEADALRELLERNRAVRTDPDLVGRAIELFLSALPLARAEPAIFAGLFELLALRGHVDEVAEIALAELLDAAVDQRSAICAADHEGASAEQRGVLNDRLSEEGWNGPFLFNAEPGSPRLIEKSSVQYTEEARKARLMGNVLVRSVISQAGDPTWLTVIDSPSPVLSEIAVESLWRWRFAPATLEGRAVSSCYSLAVNFQLQ